MRRTVLSALLLLCMLLLFGCNKNNEDNYIRFSENGVLTAETPTTEDGSVTLPIPAGIHSAYCIGWQAKVNEQTVFLPVGAEYAYEKGDNVSFTPVYLHLTTATAVEIDLTAENGGLRFTTSLPREEWNVLLAVTDTAERGTLILPLSERETLPTFTHAAVATAETLTSFDIHSTNWHKEGATLSFAAVLDNISMGNRLTPYTAVGYIKLSYSDGSTIYIYASHDQAEPVASLLGLAKTAAEDLSDTESDVYKTLVGDKYSPYTKEEYDLLINYSKIKVELILDHAVRGNRGLNAALLTAFEQRTIQQGDASCAEEWRILRGLITDIRQNGALVITAKDGTNLELDNISEITFQNKVATVKITNAIFYNGSIYVPYTTYSDNY